MRLINIRAGIVSDEVRNTLLSKLHTPNLGELVFGLVLRDSVHREATLGIVDQSEVLASLLD